MHGRPISRILFRALPPFDDHSSKRKVTPAPLAANPDLWAETSLPHAARGPYSALLPVGLAMPVRLPVPRWALTPPFHPYPDMQGGLFSVALSVRLPCPGVTRHRCSKESGLSSTRARRGHPAIRANAGLRCAWGRVNLRSIANIHGPSVCVAVHVRSCWVLANGQTIRSMRVGWRALTKVAWRDRPVVEIIRSNVRFSS